MDNTNSWGPCSITTKYVLKRLLDIWDADYDIDRSQRLNEFIEEIEHNLKVYKNETH